MVVLLIFVSITAACLAALYYGYRLAFYYRDTHKSPLDYDPAGQSEAVQEAFHRLIVEFNAVPFEEISIPSADGLKLTGRYYHVSDNGPVYIQMHGYKGNALRDFSGTWNIAKELGHNVLLVDQRCHGSSGGNTITFGIKEHLDCLAWVGYACQRFGTAPILLMGVSMGAATVLMASGLPLPENVKAIVADCPYDAPANIIRKVLGTEMGMPVKLVYPLIRLGGILYGHFDLESHSPLCAVQRANLPILLLHGDADHFVPCQMSRNLQKAAPEITELHIIPHSGHAYNQVTDPALYRSILIPFIQKHLAP